MICSEMPNMTLETSKIDQYYAILQNKRMRRCGFTKAFKNFAKYIIAFIFAKFKYFAKQVMYLESPDHPLQNDI